MDECHLATTHNTYNKHNSARVWNTVSPAKIRTKIISSCEGVLSKVCWCKTESDRMMEKLHNWALHNSSISPRVIVRTKSRKLKQATKWEILRIWCEETLHRPWVHVSTIKYGNWKRACETMCYINLEQDTTQQHDLSSSVTNLRVLWEAGHFLSTWQLRAVVLLALRQLPRTHVLYGDRRSCCLHNELRNLGCSPTMWWGNQRD